MNVQLGEYFVVTSGYTENEGLVNKRNKALLFLAVGENHYRVASQEEAQKFFSDHPILFNQF